MARFKRRDGVETIKSKPLPNKPRFRRQRRSDRTGGKVWIVFDGPDTNTAKTLALCESLEAGKAARDRTGGVLFEYDDDGKQITNERRVE
jgi:hypothetical protein